MILAIFGAFTVLGGVFWYLMKTWRFGKYMDETPHVEPIKTTVPHENPESAPTLDFSTQKAAYHSTRVIADEMGLSLNEKNDFCAVIYQESRFRKGAVGKPNKNGTIDYGLCQFNDGKNSRGVPYWIGQGAAFSSIEEVLNNPEKCVRVAIRTVKAGHWDWWSSFKSGEYRHWLAENSPMWALKS